MPDALAGSVDGRLWILRLGLLPLCAGFVCLGVGQFETTQARGQAAAETRAAIKFCVSFGFDRECK
jgi:hypothetical protein